MPGAWYISVYSVCSVVDHFLGKRAKLSGSDLSSGQVVFSRIALSPLALHRRTMAWDRARRLAAVRAERRFVTGF